MPMKIAIGMVMPMVKVPHGLFARALAITTAMPAMQRIFRKRTAKEVATPVFWPICAFAISAMDLPS